MDSHFIVHRKEGKRRESRWEELFSFRKTSLLRNLSFVSLNQELISSYCSFCVDVYYALLGVEWPRASTT